MWLKRAVQSALLRALQAARSEEARRIRECSLKQTSIGERCLVDFSRFGWKPGAHLSVGSDVNFAGACYFVRENAHVEIGSRAYFASTLSCAQSIRIGDDVLIAGGGYIADHNSHALEFPLRRNDVVDWINSRKDWTDIPIAPVTIADKAWIGWGVVILRGVTIGEGAVIGANSVITRDVAPYTVAAGNPARVLRELKRTLIADSTR